MAENILSSLPKDTFNSLGAALAKEKGIDPAAIPPVTPTIPDPNKKEETPAEEKPVQIKSEMDNPESKGEDKKEDKKEKKSDKKNKILLKGKNDKGEDTETEVKEIPQTEIDEFNEFIKDVKPANDEKPKAEQIAAENKSGKKEKKESVIPKEIEDELTAYRNTFDSPVFKAVKQFVDSGKNDIKEFVKQFDFPDYDSLTPEQVYEISLKNQGIEGDDLTEAMDEFNDYPAYKKKTTTNPIRSMLKKEADEKTKNLLHTPDPEKIKEFADFQKKAATQAINDLDERITEAATKGYKGYKLDEDEQQMIRDEVMANAIISPDGKSYDIAASFHRAVRTNDKIFSKMLFRAKEIGKYEAYEDLIKDRIRVDKNDYAVGSQSGGGSKSFEDTYVKSKGIVKQEGV